MQKVSDIEKAKRYLMRGIRIENRLSVVRWCNVVIGIINENRCEFMKRNDANNTPLGIYGLHFETLRNFAQKEQWETVFHCFYTSPGNTLSYLENLKAALNQIEGMDQNEPAGNQVKMVRVPVELFLTERENEKLKTLCELTGLQEWLAVSSIFSEYINEEIQRAIERNQRKTKNNTQEGIENVENGG